jgi:hypothetical protein
MASTTTSAEFLKAILSGRLHFTNFFYQKIVYMRHRQLTYPSLLEKRKKISFINSRIDGFISKKSREAVPLKEDQQIRRIAGS